LSHFQEKGTEERNTHGCLPRLFVVPERHKQHISDRDWILVHDDLKDIVGSEGGEKEEEGLYPLEAAHPSDHDNADLRFQSHLFENS
jgi:hypothetical protein